MTQSNSTIEVIPSARRLIRSLRDVGYDFKHAVADLVDNCIAAGASTVAIDMHFDGPQSSFRIADNGTGMNGTTITEAMRFGSEREYEADELGKFGLGLKTASLSQCLRLTVASRTDRMSKRIEVRRWDIDHVVKSNRWEIVNVHAGDRAPALLEPLQNSIGTVVLWEKLDRLLGYQIPWGERARSGFLRLAEELDQHLGMVFHRFLSGEARRRKKLRITLNGTEVEPWSPFATDERATIRLPEKQYEIYGDRGRGLVAYTPFILPRQDQFSTIKAFNKYAGPRKWNYQQGFYIYRADRLIQCGGWSYMRTSDEHTKLARVALDFWPDLDSAFDLNVAKARVNLPSSLRALLQPDVDALVKHAREVYSKRQSSGPNPDGKSSALSGGNKSHKRSASSASLKRSSAENSSSQGNSASGNSTSTGSAPTISNALEFAASSAGESEALARIKLEFKNYYPELANEIGW